MSRVGCKRDARAAKNGDLAQLDSGLYRQVYIDARSKVVYKVGHYYGPPGAVGDHTIRDDDGWCETCDTTIIDGDDNYANESEHENCQRYRAEGAAWAPPTSLYYVDGVAVLAMPFYPFGAYTSGTKSSWQERAQERIDLIMEEHYIEDLHEYNWRLTRQGHLRITDLQEF